MPNIQLRISEEDLRKLEYAFFTLGAGEQLEKELDDALFPGPADAMESAVRNLMPISWRSPAPAKISGSIAQIDLFMGFVVRTSNLTSYLRGNRYGYLFFPETGRGYTQTGKGAQRFFERAGEQELPKAEETVRKIVERVTLQAFRK